MRYFNSVLLFLLVLTNACATGKHSHKSSSPPQAEHYDVKGVVLGSSFAALAQAVKGELNCNSVSSTSEVAGIGTDTECRVKGAQKCTMLGAQQFCHSPERIDTFAGVETHITYGIKDGKVWTITLYGIRPPAFDLVLAAMQTKYGKPVITRTDIQNRMGAHFEQARAQWDARDHIVYQKYTERLDYPSSLEFYSDVAWAARKRVLEEKIDAAKSDM